MNFKGYSIFLVIGLFVIAGCQAKEEIKAAEKSPGSGFIEIATFPGDAEIFLDGVLSGKSPNTIYNVAAGTHSIVIKKSGYEDFSSQAKIEAGKKAYIEAKLMAITPAAPIEKNIEPETAKTEEKALENEIAKEENTADIKANGRINVGSAFLVYYDFNEGNFTNRRYADSEVFSQRNTRNFVFIRFVPASVNTISKGIDDVGKSDCVDKTGEYEFLNSGQTMCIKTKEGQIAAIGGNWEKTENAELIWKLFN